jgi:hypothetical protein
MLGADEARMLGNFGDRANVPPFVFATVWQDRA